MKRTKAEIYLHFVWGTWGRLPMVSEKIEREIYRCIESEARRIQCTVLALNGMPDHVHLVVRIPTRVCAAQLAQHVKGVSSTFVRDHLCQGELFRWQEGFGVFSLSRSHVQKVIAYVENQKQHHAHGKLWSEWEETDLEVEDHDMP